MSLNRLLLRLNMRGKLVRFYVSLDLPQSHLLGQSFFANLVLSNIFTVLTRLMSATSENRLIEVIGDKAQTEIGIKNN